MYYKGENMNKSMLIILFSLLSVICSSNFLFAVDVKKTVGEKVDEWIDNAADTYEKIKDSVKERIGENKEKAEKIKEQVKEEKEKVVENFDEIKDKVIDSLDNAKTRANENYREMWENFEKSRDRESKQDREQRYEKNVREKDRGDLKLIKDHLKRL